MSATFANGDLWACSACTFNNSHGSTFCEVCLLPSGANGVWTCDTCSYLNLNEVIACSMCNHFRVSAKDISCHWEWAINSSQWIPYDLPTSRHIESEYQAGTSQTSLRHGSFFSLEPTYTFHFDYVQNLFYQRNNYTGKTRLARRRDNSRGVQAVDRTAIDKDDRCVICQEKFADDEEQTGGYQAVKLKVCSGHYFHKQCIVSYVSLRGSCPVCFKSVDP
ncbi:hypothetical protein BC832DRAFT_566916 [Gaertneriomyces semiglobifer]|nr:hypothetical protein BC832DRAFT_566916 [Gaertneriomyces semiglobifer]